MTSSVSIVFNKPLHDFLFLTFFILSITWIGFYDKEYHRIPNRSLTGLCALRVIYVLIGDRPGIALLESILSCLFITLLILVIGTILLIEKFKVGGGDYKYIITLGFCMNFDQFLLAMIVTLIIVLFVGIPKSTQTKKAGLLSAAPFLSVGGTIAIILSLVIA